MNEYTSRSEKIKMQIKIFKYSTSKQIRLEIENKTETGCKF